jgi:hypothetical protein
MKVPVLVSFEQEVEVSVTAEDIARALAEDPKSSQHALRGISNAAAFIKAIPEEMIKEMGDPARRTIATFFTEQAKRFDPTP